MPWNYLSLIFLSGLCSLIHAQNLAFCPGLDTKEPLPYENSPEIPKSYYAHVLVQSAETNQTTAIEYANDGGPHGLIKYYNDGFLTTTLFDGERNQFIIASINVRDTGNGEGVCMVRNLYPWELGKKYVEQDMIVNGVDWFLRFRKHDKVQKKGAIYLGEAIENGVPIKRWTECLYWPEESATANVTFSWVDTEKWQTLPGTEQQTSNNYQMPYSVSVVGEGKFTLNPDTKKHEMNEINDYATFTYFETSPAPRKSLFNIPDRVICDDISSINYTLPKLPAHFSYETEIIATDNSAAPLTHPVITYQRHLYDGQMNITRWDLRPLSPHDKYDTNLPDVKGIISRIDDFWTGLSYTIDQGTGKCEIGFINNQSDDAQIISGNHAIIRDPISYLGLGKLKFSYYNKGLYRGIEANEFRAQDKVYGHQLVITAPSDEVQGSNLWSHREPMRYVKFNLKKPFGDDRVQFNIFRFDPDRPNIFDYDISECFHGKDKRHFMFKIKGTEDILKLSNKEAFKYEILLTIIQNSNVTPLRVTRIELDANDQDTYVIFTMLEKIVFEKDNEFNKGELETDDAIGMFKMQLNDKKISIIAPSPVSVVVEGIPGSFEEVERLEENAILPRKQEKASYSSGAMAGLAIGMIILGIGCGCLAAHFYRKKKGL